MGDLAKPGRTFASGKWTIASVLGVLLAWAGAWALATSSSARHDPVPATTGRQTLESLPAGARGPISAVLGRDEPAFTVRGLQAVNPAQHLRANWSPSGLSVSSGDARVGLSLTAYGYAGAMRALPAVAPSARSNRVTYSRGRLVEWYANGPLGIEQGFTLSRPPDRGAGPLTFDLLLSGDTRARLQDGSVLLRGPGRSLRYGGLVASDARGRVLPASLQLHDGQIRVRVDDHDARYPLRIDPIIQQASQLTANNGAADDMLGTSVAVSGNTVFVGAPANSQPVYVFVKPASGWSGTVHQTATLSETTPQANDEFGFSIAVSGETVVVGASAHGNTGQGAAFVFGEPAGGWSGAVHQLATLSANDAAMNDGLGFSVAISGNTVVAGVPRRAVGANLKQGAADVFVEPSGGWSGNVNQAAELTATDGNANDQLGTSVAMSGATVVAGAPGHNVGNNLQQGAAYVFLASTGGWAGNINQAAELTAGDGSANDQLGLATAVSGDTAFAGGFGGAYAFVEPTAGWSGTRTQTAKLVANGVPPGGEVGRALAASGNVVLVGAPLQKVGPGNIESGAVFVFVTPGGGWSGSVGQTAELTSSDGGSMDTFGDAVGLSGDLAAAGAMGHKVDNNQMQGAAYVFGIGAPSITIKVPTEGTTLARHQKADASYSCTAPPDVTVTGCAGPVASGAPIDTATTGAHTFTVKATGSDGFTAITTVRYLVARSATARAPAISRARLTSKRFRVGAKATPVTAKAKSRTAPLGTTFRFTLSVAAKLRIAFRRTAPGLRRGRGCRAPTAKLRHEHLKRCTRTLAVGTLVRAHEAAGADRVAFSGRIGRRALNPGAYHAVLSASDRAGVSKSVTLAFTVVR